MLELLQLLQKLFAAFTGAVSASAEAVAASAGAVTTCAEAVTASAGAVFWCFQLSFFFWKNYMFSPYIILVSNRLVG